MSPDAIVSVAAATAIAILSAAATAIAMVAAIRQDVHWIKREIGNAAARLDRIDETLRDHDRAIAAGHQANVRPYSSE